MESNSDTESDCSSSSPLPNASELRDPILLTLPAPVAVNLEEVKQHMDKLSVNDFLGGSNSLKNASLLNELQESANTLISFVDQLPDLLLKNEASDVSAVFAAFGMLCGFYLFLRGMTHHQLAVDISFLDRLFVYRQKIRHTAINVKGTSRPSAVVTWVDELLAKVNDTLRIVSWGGALPVEDIEYSSTTHSIESQKRHDVLRAVIQLPGMFNSFFVSFP